MTTLEMGLAIALIVVTVAAIFRMTWMARRTATIDEWRVQARRLNDIYEARLHDVEPREARFRQALGYYADEETWVAPGRAHSPAFRDRGRTARAALDDR